MLLRDILIEPINRELISNIILTNQITDEYYINISSSLSG